MDRDAQKERDLRWDILLEEYPLHMHTETKGSGVTLTEKGVRYPGSAKH